MFHGEPYRHSLQGHICYQLYMKFTKNLYLYQEQKRVFHKKKGGETKKPII